MSRLFSYSQKGISLGVLFLAWFHSLPHRTTPSPNPWSPAADCQRHTSFPASPPKTRAGSQLVQSPTWLNPTSDYRTTPTTCSNPPLDSSLLAMRSPILSLSQIPYPAHYALLGLLSSTIPIRPIIPLPRLFYPPPRRAGWWMPAAVAACLPVQPWAGQVWSLHQTDLRKDAFFEAI